MNSLTTITLGQIRFSPRWASTISTLLIFPCLVYLGFWQLHRYENKANQKKEFETRITMPIINTLPAIAITANSMDTLRYRQLQAKGYFLNDYLFLLDNQILKGKAGYRVIMPFQLLDSPTLLLVDRGWIAPGKTRSDLPKPPPILNMVTIQGIINLPVQGLQLKKANELKKTGGSLLIQQIDFQALSLFLNSQIYPFVLQLNSDTPYGLMTMPISFNISIDRHLGYAIQWFTMALASIIYYIVINSQRLIHV